MAAAALTPTCPTTTLVLSTAPVWSPDGSRIVFTSSRDGNSEIYVMDADGQNLTNLTNHSADDFRASWGVAP